MKMGNKSGVDTGQDMNEPKWISFPKPFSSLSLWGTESTLGKSKVPSRTEGLQGWAGRGWRGQTQGRVRIPRWKLRDMAPCSCTSADRPPAGQLLYLYDVITKYHSAPVIPTHRMDYKRKHLAFRNGRTGLQIKLDSSLPRIHLSFCCPVLYAYH